MGLRLMRPTPSGDVSHVLRLMCLTFRSGLAARHIIRRIARYIVAEMRAGLVCCLAAFALVGCGSITSTPTVPSGPVEPGTMVFSGAVSGGQQTGEVGMRAGREREFTDTSLFLEGILNGKPYFLRLNAYPYHGADTYRSIYHQPEPLANHGTSATPDPLMEAAPNGY